MHTSKSAVRNFAIRLGLAYMMYILQGGGGIAGTDIFATDLLRQRRPFRFAGKHVDLRCGKPAQQQQADKR